MDTDRVQVGRALRERAQGEKHEAFAAGLRELDPRMADWADGWVFGEVWRDPDLDFAERMLVAIVALGATSKLGQLRNYLHGALQAGLPASRIHGALLMLPVYIGFPSAIDALVVWREVVASARRRGLDIDLPGD